MYHVIMRTDMRVIRLTSSLNLFFPLQFDLPNKLLNIPYSNCLSFPEKSMISVVSRLNICLGHYLLSMLL